MISSDADFVRIAGDLEALDLAEDVRDLNAEERELQALLAHLFAQYEDRTPPLGVLVYLMDDFGSLALVSQVLSGKREVSKAHEGRLAERFRLLMEAFISPMKRAAFFDMAMKSRIPMAEFLRTSYQIRSRTT